MTGIALTHKCPRPGCEKQVSRSRLMCGADWGQVPKPLQREVTVAWDRGRGIFSDRYAEARQAAIDAVTP
jgi:hypothetical protein